MLKLIICMAIVATAYVIGVIVGRITKKEQSVGTIIIDHESVPEEEPYLFLQSKVNPRELVTRKTVVFDVVVEKFLSQN